MKFDDILEKLEKDGKILDFRFHKSQIPMYLLDRITLIQSLIDKEFNLSNNEIKVNIKVNIMILKYIYHTIKSNIFFAPKKDIYSFSTDKVSQLENGQYINRLYDDFNELFYDKTQIIEKSMNFSYSLPKKKIYFQDLIKIMVGIASKTMRVNKKDLEEIESFINYLQQNTTLFENNYNLEEVRNRLIKLSKSINFSYWMYKQLFKIKKPKLIIVNCGHYLTDIPLISAAKSLGIKTAEYQHGYVGLAHPAYNYHKNIFSKINEYLPEYFLTHGEYWNSVIRIPSEKIAIGLPSLSKKIDKITRVKKQKNIILFISGGTVYETLNEFIEKSLVDLYELGYKVLLRPHPSEILATQERYYNLIKLGVQIDTANLYDTLEEVDVVVGMEVSTVLYESVCFTNKVYLMNTKYIRFYEPKSCFILFTNKDELIAFIKEKTVLKLEANYFWNDNWDENYKQFIQNSIGIK